MCKAEETAKRLHLLLSEVPSAAKAKLICWHLAARLEAVPFHGHPRTNRCLCFSATEIALLFRAKRGQLYQLSYWLRRRVQAAFCFAEARPAASARVFAGLDGTSAVGAADAGIILIV